MNIFLKTFNDIVKEIKNNRPLLNEIEFIALLGSVAEKEAIINYSDLDILLILKSNQCGTIKFNTLLKLKDIAFKFSSKYNVKISFLTHTFDDFKNYVDIDYLTHYSLGIVIYPKSKSLAKEINKIIKQKSIGRAGGVKDLIVYNLRHARFNLLREFVSLNKYNTNHYIRTFGRILIDKIFNICDWCLIYDNIWSKSKKEIVNNINKKYGNSISLKPLKEAYDIRKGWNKIRNKDLENFFTSGIEFIVEIIELIIKRNLKK